MVRLILRRLVSENVPSGNNTTDSNHTEKTSFDMNTIVVIVALLCTLIVALAVNSIIHYALRRRRALLEAEAAMAAGVEKHTISKIPVEVFRLEAEIPVTECAICLGDFEDGEKVRVLPECNHEFHVKCVDKWLIEHMSCPTCRHLVALLPI